MRVRRARTRLVGTRGPRGTRWRTRKGRAGLRGKERRGRRCGAGGARAERRPKRPGRSIRNHAGGTHWAAAGTRQPPVATSGGVAGPFRQHSHLPRARGAPRRWRKRAPRRGQAPRVRVPRRVPRRRPRVPERARQALGRAGHALGVRLLRTVLARRGPGEAEAPATGPGGGPRAEAARRRRTRRAGRAHRRPANREPGRPGQGQRAAPPDSFPE